MNIKDDQFTHLHCHSHHSLKDGTIPVRDIVDSQVERGAKGVAITDHGTMTGSWFLYDHIHNVRKYENVKHIIGCELYVNLTRDELFEWLPNAKKLEPDTDKRNAKRKMLGKKYHQIALAKNKIGYQNLIKIHNEAWENGFYYSPMTTPEKIFENHEGIIVTTTCLGSVWNQYIMSGRIQDAENEIYRWKEVFGEDFYIELQTINSNEQRLVNNTLIDLANRTKTQLVVTNDVHYLNAEDEEFHHILLNMDQLKKKADGEDVDAQKMWEFGVDDLYMKNLDQMKESWKNIHKSKEFTESNFESSILGVNDIVEKIEHYTLESKPLLPTVSDMPPLDELTTRVVKGFKNKIREGIIPKDRIKEYEQRMLEEIKVISALNAENYILICNEITNYCHDNNIAVGFGRGSAGGSLLLYLLGVTGLDPIKHKLLFARFLNMNRRPKLQM